VTDKQISKAYDDSQNLMLEPEYHLMDEIGPEGTDGN